MKSLMRENTAPINVESAQKGIKNLQEMLLLKNQARKISHKANIKPKVFHATVDQVFEHLDEASRTRIEAKILLNSRKVKIDSIAEIIGGKTERAKQTLMSYLERQDYIDSDYEHSLRSFLQTFRMAGVES